MATEAVGITFTSCDVFSVLFSYGTVGSWKIVDGSFVSFNRGMPLFELMEFQQVKFFKLEKYPVKKSFWSHSGDFILVDCGCRIVLFEAEKSTLVKEAIEGCVTCLTFSADDSCIQTIDDDQDFYIWDVNTSTLTGPLCLDRSVGFNMRADCCCFSSDNSKLFFAMRFLF